MTFYIGLVLFGGGLSYALGIGWGVASVGLVLLAAATVGAMRQ